MLKQALSILDHMDQKDADVITLKSILSSYIHSKKIYMLRYKGEFLNFRIDVNNTEFANTSTIYLTNDSYYPIWTTDDIRIATYNKYISTPWYNSELNQTTHLYKYNPEDIEIVDSFGKVYNTRPMNNKTLAIIKDKIFGDSGYLKFIADGTMDTNGYAGYYNQMYLLQEAKIRFNQGLMKINLNKPSTYSIDDLYDYRKQLIRIKGSKIKSNKPYKAIQNKLDKVNSLIKSRGGK